MKMDLKSDTKVSALNSFDAQNLISMYEPPLFNYARKQNDSLCSFLKHFRNHW